MQNSRFIHLRLHSEYSVTDGIARLDDAVKAAASDGQGALALTDLGNLFGVVKFYQKARSVGVKPIVGCDVWVTNPLDMDKPARVLLLVRDRQGYLNLCELLSRAWLTNQHRGRAQIQIEWLESGLANGLIALSGGLSGDIGQAFSVGNEAAARRHAQRWARIFPDGFYIEVQRAGLPGEAAYIQQAAALAAELQLPVVATHPVQFMTPDDFTAHEARVCIAEGNLLANPRRAKHFTRAQYFRTQADMAELFADLPVALANTMEIAQRCNLTLELGKPKLPLFPTPADLSLDDYLMQQAQQGLELRLEQLFADPTQRERERPTYCQRLEFECATIIKMGFAGYFLIVADFINWAKQNGVPVGPGRGSGAGSLVAFVLGITDLDPLRYKLLFERFLNPERVSMPDFDIDFCQHGRDRVIQYVKSKYGADAVSQIATFGTMAAKAAVRDIGRVLDLGYTFTDGIAKLIPFKPGKHVTIADAIKEEPLLAQRLADEDEVQQLLELAQRVEGLTRNVGMHAGGVLIAPGKLTHFCPLYTQHMPLAQNATELPEAQAPSAAVVSQYDKDDVEAVGLVKFDFLGLTTLTILDWAERDIRRLDPSRSAWSLAQVPLNDSATFSFLKKANTVAVFQLESRGMQGMLKDAQPDRFEDIIALVALYRPGPMDLIPSFCARKHGREKVDYPDPRVKAVLEETYGIMVYQEQVMQMAQIIGGYSLGGADLLRRAMGKKKPEEMAQHRELFREGAAQNGLTREKADEIFDLMEKFAGYGFNKSHAAAYALLAYHTAWLKAHYPAEFMAANMSLALDDTDKIKILFEDCLANQLTVLPPDINRSVYRFEPAAAAGQPARMIHYGLGAIKGSGQSAIEDILRARAEQPFTDLFDFCLRIDRRMVNRRTIEALIRAGAFDSLQTNRAQLLASVSLALEAAEQRCAHALQAGLFDHTELADGCELVAEAAWPQKRLLQEEKAALGFYLSGHLFDAYRHEVSRFVKQKLNNLQEGREKRVAGVISSMRTQLTQRGKMLIVMLDDGTAQCEVTVFNELYEANRELFKEDELLVVMGNARYDSFTGGIRFNAETVLDLARARSSFARALRISVSGQVQLLRLHELLQSHRVSSDLSAPSNKMQPALSNEIQPPVSRAYGAPKKDHSDASLPVLIDYSNQAIRSEFTLGDKWRVKPADELLLGLQAEDWATAVEVVY